MKINDIQNVTNTIQEYYDYVNRIIITFISFIVLSEIYKIRICHIPVTYEYIHTYIHTCWNQYRKGALSALYLVLYLSFYIVKKLYLKIFKFNVIFVNVKIDTVTMNLINNRKFGVH